MVVNLNKLPKQKAREAAEVRAAENRTRFGRSKAQKQRDAAEAAEARRRLEALRSSSRRRRRGVITLYGIRNCQTVQRAREYLQAQGIDYRFHDFKTDGLPPQRARQWLDQLGLEVLLNRKGTIWRKLDGPRRLRSVAPRRSICCVQHPSVIRRPVIEPDGALRVRFARGEEEALLRWLRG